MDFAAGIRCRTYPLFRPRMAFAAMMIIVLAVAVSPMDAAGTVALKSMPAAYRLSAGDLIEVAVFNAPEFSTSQRLNADGVVQIPLLGGVPVSGDTIQEAQTRVSTALMESELLVKPSVTIVVREYALRQALVYGQVVNQGPVRFPPEKSELDLVEVISMAGGFTRIAKKKQVTIVRIGPDGAQSTQIVNVDGMIDGLRREAIERVFIRPGDVINVREIIY